MKLSDISKNKLNSMPDPLDSRLDIADKLQYTDPKQAYDIAYALCREIDENLHPKIYLRSLFLKGRTSWYMGRFDDALFGGTELLEKAQAQNNISYQAEALNLLGNVNLHMDNLDQALEYYRDGLKFAKVSHNGRAESSLYNNIGEIYNRLGANDQAKEYYEKALRIATAIQDSNGIGIAYLNLGEIAMKSELYSDALKRIDDALLVFKNAHDKLGEANVLWLQGDTHAKIGNLDLAESLYIRAEEIELETGDQYNLLRTGIALVKVLIEKSKLNDAEVKCLGLVELADNLHTSDNTALVLSLLANIYEKKQEFEKALTYYKRYHDSDLINQKETLDERLNHVRSQFKIEQAHHEKEIFRLKNVELKSKHSELQKLYENIGIISEIGRDITSTLNLTDVFKRIYNNLNNLMDATFFGISLYDKKDNSITFPMFITSGELSDFESTVLDDTNSLSAWCIRNQKDIVINDYLSEYQTYKHDPMEHRFGQLSQSVLYVPLFIEGHIIGTVTAQSYERNAYTKHHLDMLKALASYMAIAIQNGQESKQLADEIQRRKEIQNSLESLNKRLTEMTYMDALTKIPNRRHFVDALTRELNRSIREQESLAVVLIDIDKFKEYNDNYGHTSGDTCLEAVARVLENSLKRKTDFVARYGGDEFVAVLPNTDLKGAQLVAETMRSNLELTQMEHAYSNVSPLVSITLGIYAEIPQDGMTLERAVQLADQALYTAKDMGRNCIASNISPISLDQRKA